MAELVDVSCGGSGRSNSQRVRQTAIAGSNPALNTNKKNYMKTREKIQHILNIRFPFNNILINDEGDLQYDISCGNEEKEIINYAAGILAGIQININESIES